MTLGGSLVRNMDSPLPQVKTWLWDSNAAFTKVLDNPTAYGFVDNTSYGDNTNDFWGNNYHPSSAFIPMFICSGV